jgi:hypothetical protein
MFRSYLLQPATAHDQPLEFEWNPETGELRGKSADIIAGICRQAIREGWVTSHPYPTEYEITDPLRRPAEMAVVLGQYWWLDGDLPEKYPSQTDQMNIYDDEVAY